MDPDSRKLQISMNLHFTESTLWLTWRPLHPTSQLELGHPEEVLALLPGPGGQDWYQIPSRGGTTCTSTHTNGG